MKSLMLIALFVSACGGKQGQHVEAQALSAQTTLSDTDASLLYKLNQSHVDLILAAGVTAAPAINKADPNIHVQALTRRIALGTCQSTTWEAFTPDFAKDWEITQATNQALSQATNEALSVGACSLSYRKHWSYDKARSHLTFNYDLNLADEELRKISDITKVTAHGDMNAEADKRSNGTRVRGQMLMPIESQTLGVIKIKVIASAGFSSARGESVVTAIIHLADNRSHIARVHWESTHPERREYFVDNIRLTPARFQDLFSALSLDEIMDNSLKMR